MKRTNYDLGWRFTLNGATDIDVNLPHDFSIGQPRTPDSRMGIQGGFCQGGNGVYRKTLKLPESLNGGKVILEVEGAYMNAEVTINGNLAAFNPYGYTTFHADLTSWMKAEADNEIEIRVSNDALPNSRWYTGSGLYRHVWLLTGRESHIAPWGIFVSMPVVDEKHSLLVVETDVCGSGSLRHTLLDASGKTVVSSEAMATTGKNTQEISVANARLWDTESPYLYTLVSDLCDCGQLVDKVETPVGIRSIALDKERGFLLNGKPLKLKGGCVHHDCGILGAAAYDRAEEHKVLVHRAGGFNAIRCAHNPPSPAFLDACDRHGIIVIDEAFDCWRMGKNPYDYHLYFEGWWKKDVAAMVLRDRNHPCIAFWSLGNEISEQIGKSDGYVQAARLAAAVRELDSTRFITYAFCGSFLKWSLEMEQECEPFTPPLDVIGYNYLWQYYEGILDRHSEMLIFSTETIAAEAFESWTMVEKYPRVLGDFVWTSVDYLGESGIGYNYLANGGKNTFEPEYPWHLANCGDFDICCRPRPQSYYRQILWGHRTAPWIAVHRPNGQALKSEHSYWGWSDVHHSWSWPGSQGCTVHIDVYSQCDEVELFLNGRSLERKPAGKIARNIASFEAIYEPGELLAVSYLNGQTTGEDKISTCGKPKAICLDVDNLKINASYGDLAYVTATVVDSAGSAVPYAGNELFFTVCGAGELAAIGTNDPLSKEPYVGNRRKAFEGSVVAVVRSNGSTGEIVLTVSADGLTTASILLIAKQNAKEN